MAETRHRQIGSSSRQSGTELRLHAAWTSDRLPAVVVMLIAEERVDPAGEREELATEPGSGR